MSLTSRSMPQLKAQGHVTNTTRTQQVRAQKSLLGLNNTLDGSGVTIAVVDSGIDSKHKSFATTGKIKFNKDFTGENRTDDPWGHGTHVRLEDAVGHDHRAEILRHN